jgi:hypothetical protein
VPPSPVTKPLQALEPVIVPIVPLSCVPPKRSRSGFDGFTAMPWNWSVERPSLMTCRFVGIAFSQRWQFVRSAPVRLRPAHCHVPSASAPLERITPPSEPTTKRSWFPGTNMIACWSGCMSSNALRLSPVMSVNERPPSVERITARPSDGSGPA